MPAPAWTIRVMGFDGYGLAPRAFPDPKATNRTTKNNTDNLDRFFIMYLHDGSGTPTVSQKNRSGRNEKLRIS
jgi:hypothetical protein